MKDASAMRGPLALAIALALGCGGVHAANITVTDGGDSGTISSCTLRQAVASARSDGADTTIGTCVHGSAADVIDFSATLAGATIELSDGQLAIGDDPLVPNVSPNLDLRINGGGQTIDANGISRVVYVGSGARAMLINLKLTGGVAASKGGGILLDGGAHLDLVDATVSGNTVTGAAYGGGIACSASSTLNVVDTTINGNTGSLGGGIYANNAVLTFYNSTITGNSAGQGAAVGVFNSNVSFEGVTVSGNTTGIWASTYPASGASPTAVSLANTIFSDNNAAWVTQGSGNSITANYSLLATNLQSVLASGANNQFNDDPGLRPLANNSGASPTMLPKPTSLAIDQGSNALVPSVFVYDQRNVGHPRILRNVVDIGAVEISDVELDRIFANGFDDASVL